MWNVPSCTPIRSLRGHSDRVGGVAWHPQSTLTQSPDAVNLVSGAADCKLHLWSLNSDTPLSTLKGHQDRVCRVAFHPSGSYVASASYDTTWRLWDVNTCKHYVAYSSSTTHSNYNQLRNFYYKKAIRKEYTRSSFREMGPWLLQGEYPYFLALPLTDLLCIHLSAASTPLAAFGTFVRVERQWYWMVMYRGYIVLGFHLTGTWIARMFSYHSPFLTSSL